MSYMSELHYQRANTNPRELWDGFSETEDGFEPEYPTEAELDALDAAYHAAMDAAHAERAVVAADIARLARWDMHLAAIVSPATEPF